MMGYSITRITAFCRRPFGGARRGRAFTLIELLIVVIIVAILAAIAAPNYLEAQARAKVARSRSDMRTMAAAIEAYRVDANRPPLNGVLNVDGSWQDPHLVPSPPPAPAHKFLNAMLTTPVAYLTALPPDAFVEGATAPYPDWAPYYDRYFYTNLDHFETLMTPAGSPALLATIAGMKERYGSWILAGAGPDGDRLDLASHTFYDPTNGTISSGDLLRCPMRSE